MAKMKSAIAILPAILAGAVLLSAAFRAPSAEAVVGNSTLTVNTAGSGFGTVTSNVGAINCGAACLDTYPNGTAIVLSATPALGSQFTGWLGPCTGIGACNFTITGTTSAEATFAPTSIGTPRLDIDGTATYDALTDGLLVIRHLFGLSGATLITGAVGPGAARSTDTQIHGYLTDIKPVLDIDGNGQVDAFSDGLLIIRYLFGVRGSSLIDGAVGSKATHVTANDIETQIKLRSGFCLDGVVPRPVATPTAGALVITEFLANPAGTADAQREWFEIMNTGATAFDINGLELARSGVAGNLISTTTCKPVPAGGFALFARSADPALNGLLPPVDDTFAFSLPDSNGSIEVRNGATILDAITWTTGIVSGQSKQLDPGFLTVIGNDTTTNFCNSTVPYGDTTNTGSPKVGNTPCP